MEVNAYTNDIILGNGSVCMNMKLPYYMAYPMPLIYDDERIERRDYEYMKSMYPDAAKRILPYVEEECDRRDDARGMMYDEYPDKLQIRLMGRRIYERVMQNERSLRGPEHQKNDAENTDTLRDGQSWIRDLIEVLLYQELYKRRSDHRRARRKYY